MQLSTVTLRTKEMPWGLTIHIHMMQNNANVWVLIGGRGCKYHDWQTQQTPPKFRLLDSQFSQFYCSAAQMITFATIVCPLIHTCIRCWQRDSQSFSCHLSAHKHFTTAWTAIPRRGFPYRSASQGKTEAVEESLRFLVVLIWLPESPPKYPKTEFWGIGLHVFPAFPVTQRKQS